MLWPWETAAGEDARENWWNKAWAVLSPKKPLEADEEALMKAAAEGDETKVGQLIACGTDVKIKNEEGKTPLHHAAMQCHPAVVAQLLAAGANLKDIQFVARPGHLTRHCQKVHALEQE
ncbi:hypothetical protein T484DRAFT_1803384 [Baffinella frigidus]|nr:hypothetical protein T484DRAFT_1803384 [Cryptophyta sp. CCMP2293]